MFFSAFSAPPRRNCSTPRAGRRSFSAYTRGAVTALAFFYAHCVDPAGCPLAWSTFETVARDANDDPLLKSRLRLVFASLDPEHDTPNVMRLLQSSENEADKVPWAFVTSRSLSDLSPLIAQMGQDIAFEADQTGRRSARSIICSRFF